MNNSGTEYNGVIVCGPPASPDPDQPASPDPEDIYNGKHVSPTLEMINYKTVTGYGSPQTAYCVDSYERNRIKPCSPISPAESDTYSESRSSVLQGPELMSTLVKQSAPNYMLEPYFEQRERS